MTFPFTIFQFKLNFNPLMLSWLKEITGSFSPVYKKMVKNTGWLLADKVIRVAVGIFVLVWVARYLGPGQYGLLNYAIALVGLLTPIAALGLDNIVVRDLVNLKDRRNLTLGSAFIARVTGSVLTLSIAFLIISLIRPGEDLTRTLVLIIAAAGVFQSFDVIDFYYQSEVQSRYTVIARSSSFMIASLFKILLILSEAPLVAFAWIYLFEIAAGSVGLLLTYSFNGFSPLKWKFDKTRMKTMLKDSLPLAAAGAAVLVYMKIDILLLGDMKGETEAGIYSAAARISESFYFLSMIISSSTFPILMENKDLFFERFRKISGTMVLLAYAISIPVFIFSNLIISIFGKDYIAAGPVLAIHIWSTLFIFLSVIQGSWYIQNGSRGIYMQLRRTIGGAIFNILLNILLIPPYGSSGAAIATILSYSYVGFFSNAFHKDTRHIFNLQLNAILLIDLFRRLKR
jgi:polysaccharide transporter, PST family